MKTNVRNAREMCIRTGRKLGTMPGTSYHWFVVDGVVWLVTDRHAVNNGGYAEFMDAVRAGKVRFLHLPA